MDDVRQLQKLGAPILLMALCAGCSNGLVDESHEGEPLAEVNGTLSVANPKAVTEPISIAVAWLDAPPGGFDMDMMGQPDTEPAHDPYADDTDGIPEVDTGTDPLPEPEEEDACPDFDGDEEGEVTCDGTLAPHQTATCTETAGSIWSLQATEYKAKSLIEFTLPIYDLPPEAARRDLSAAGVDGWMAEGIIVAFSDENGDQRFEKGNLRRIKDRLLSSSVLETPKTRYVGKIVFYSGKDSEETQALFGWALQQGFNLIIEDDEGSRVAPMSHSVELIPLTESGAGVELAALQCTELEYRYDFNGPVPESWTQNCEAGEWGTYYPSDDGMVTDGTYLEWQNATADPDHPCVIHVSTGFACYSDIGQLPEEWLGICGGLVPLK
jgi:hypothetical protein